jgi:NTP pyrophosphatase (non-canonical NTP hydrolase)
VTIRELQHKAWSTAEQKGFHDGHTSGRADTLLRLCLIHTEVSEAAQEVKRHWTDSPGEDLKDRVAGELADILIRVADLAGCIDVDLEMATAAKLVANMARPHQYGTPKESR